MTNTANPQDLAESTRPVAALHQGGPMGHAGRRSSFLAHPTRSLLSARDPEIENGLWKLPEPWTPRTRPPLLGKPHRTRFPTATTGPLIGNRSVTHVPG